MSTLLRTPLYDLHAEHGAKFIPFAGYEMPVQYKLGIMKEHLHCRTKAGLFDVSHMGQLQLNSKFSSTLEKLIPQDVTTLNEGRQRYGFFTNEDGGIEDDLMFANRGDHIYLVVNAACKQKDIAHLRSYLDENLKVITDRALLALQGPLAETIIAQFAPEVTEMRFMDVKDVQILGTTCWISRSGYTGEDGFEISIPNTKIEEIAHALLKNDALELIGLGARDSLRMEAGLCLYGHEIDATTSPIEADLVWAIQKRRRENGGFIGEGRILQELNQGTARKRVGLRPLGRAPMREKTVLFADETSDDYIGHITSGGFGPSVGAPIAMGYVKSQYSETGTKIWGELRGKRQPVEICKFPFTPLNFKR